MTLDHDRVSEVLWLLSKMLNISEDCKLHGVPVREWLPHITKDLTVAIKQNEDQAEAILSWLADAIFYMRQDSDELPRCEIEWEI